MCSIRNCKEKQEVMRFGHKRKPVKAKFSWVVHLAYLAQPEPGGGCSVVAAPGTKRTVSPAIQNRGHQ